MCVCVCVLERERERERLTAIDECRGKLRVGGKLEIELAFDLSRFSAEVFPA